MDRKGGKRGKDKKAKNPRQGACVPPLEIQFMWGRQDCGTSPTTAVVYPFPSPEMSRSVMYEYFSTTFGMNEFNTTAVMGAHTLGNALIANSGYDGDWVDGQDLFFNNRFYQLMIESGISWDKVNVNNAQPPKWQFNGRQASTPVGMMFNTDMDLFYDVTVGTAGEPQCTPGPTGDCLPASSFTDAVSFAGDNAVWMSAFSVAFEKMQSKGSWTLQPLV